MKYKFSTCPLGKNGKPLFIPSEFDCKTKPSTGLNMDSEFMEALVDARIIFGILRFNQENKLNRVVPSRRNELRDLAPKFLSYSLPFVIVSGFRTRKHNDAVGGVSNSQHLEGKAVDLYASPYSIKNVHLLLRSLVLAGFRCFGINNAAVHVDSRNFNTNLFKKWTYKGVDADYVRACYAVIESTQVGVREYDNSQENYYDV